MMIEMLNREMLLGKPIKKEKKKEEPKKKTKLSDFLAAQKDAYFAKKK